MQNTVISQTTSGCQLRGRKQGCDRAWIDSLGVSFALKEGQLLGERSQNHTDEPMDGASVSQARVLQCSFHPLFPSLSLARSPSSLFRHPSRHPHHPFSPSFPLPISLPPPTSLSRSFETAQPSSISRPDLALPFYAIHHLSTPRLFPFASSLQMSPRGRLTFALRPLGRPRPPFSRPFDWSQLFTTKGWSINRRPPTPSV